METKKKKKKMEKNCCGGKSGDDNNNNENKHKNRSSSSKAKERCDSECDSSSKSLFGNEDSDIDFSKSSRPSTSTSTKDVQDSEEADIIFENVISDMMKTMFSDEMNSYMDTLADSDSKDGNCKGKENIEIEESKRKQGFFEGIVSNKAWEKMKPKLEESYLKCKENLLRKKGMENSKEPINEAEMFLMFAKGVDKCAEKEKTKWHKIIDDMKGELIENKQKQDEEKDCTSTTTTTSTPSTTTTTLTQSKKKDERKPLPKNTEQIFHNKYTASLVSTTADSIAIETKWVHKATS